MARRRPVIRQRFSQRLGVDKDGRLYVLPPTFEELWLALAGVESKRGRLQPLGGPYDQT